MKERIMLCFSFILSLQFLNAQITIFQNSHEPASGDIRSLIYYDSTSLIPRNGGTSQVWDFSTLTLTPVNSPSEISTWTVASSVPESSLFPTATLAEVNNYGEIRFHKSSASPLQFEFLGFYHSSVIHTFTNTSIEFTWPFSYGNSFTDNWSGTIGPGTGGTFTGTTTTTGSGTGNLIFPGGKVYSNILQVKQDLDIFMHFANSSTLAVNETIYSYFHGSTKFPILTITYIEQQAPTISVNKNITVGLTDYNFDATFAIYPNPTRYNFSIRLSNSFKEECIITLYNSAGQLVLKKDIGSNPILETQVNLQDFAPGIYLVHTQLGQKSSTRRLIVE